MQRVKKECEMLGNWYITVEKTLLFFSFILFLSSFYKQMFELIRSVYICMYMHVIPCAYHHVHIYLCLL